MLFTPLKTESKRNFEEVVSSQLWKPGQLGAHPPPGGHEALGEQGKVGAHTGLPPPQAHEQRINPFCALGFPLAK